MSRSINRWFGLGLATAALMVEPASARDRSRPGGPTEPPSKWFTDADYPASASRAGGQGKVQVEVSIDDQGAVIDCQVVMSSGSAALDRKTCDIVEERGKFRIQLNKSGRPVDYTYKVDMFWVMAMAGKMPLGPWRTSSVVEIAENGTPASCKQQDSAILRGRTPYPCAIVGRLPRDFALLVREGASGNGPMPAVFESTMALDGEISLPMTYLQPNRTLMSLLVLHFEIDAKGNTHDCKVVSTNGIIASGDPCASVKESFERPPRPIGATMTLAISRAGR